MLQVMARMMAQIADRNPRSPFSEVPGDAFNFPHIDHLVKPDVFATGDVDKGGS